jgi:hypothetical protein
MITERITAIRVVPLPRPASGFVAQDDGTVGMAVNGTAVVMTINSAELRQMADLLNSIAAKLDLRSERPDDLAMVLAQVGTAGSA